MECFPSYRDCPLPLDTLAIACVGIGLAIHGLSHDLPLLSVARTSSPLLHFGPPCLLRAPNAYSSSPMSETRERQRRRVFSG